MALFRYEAVDRAGKVVRGVMNARDEQEVAQKLSAMGYSARGVYGGGGGQAATAAAGAQAATPKTAGGMQSVTLASGVPVSIKSKVPIGQLAMFFRQVATLVRSGMPLSQSFRDMATATRNRRLKTALPEMNSGIETGRTLSSSMAAFPDIFPAHTIASVWTGELCGKLDIVLDEIATDLEQEASETRFARIGWGLTKISIICLLLTIPLFNMSLLLAPITDDGPQNAAVNTQSILNNYLSGYWQSFKTQCVPIVIAIIVAWLVLGVLKRIPAFRRLLDGIILRVPVWGRLHRYRSITRFLHRLDQLYAAGVNPSTAWDAASLTPANNEIAERLKLARSRGSGVGAIADLAMVAGVLEPEDVSMIATGEKSGRVPEVCAKLSEIYADKAASQRTVARTWSVSLLISSQLALGGGVMIFMASTYARALYKLMGF